MTNLSLPWLSSHGLDLNINHLNKIHKNYSSKIERYLDWQLLTSFVCIRGDEYDDSEIAEPSYIYGSQFCGKDGARDLLALGNEDGKVILQNTAYHGKKSFVAYFEAHNNAIFDLAWVPGSDSSLVTVSGDQTAKLWDFNNLTTSAVEEVREFRGYSRSVKCVEFVPNNVNLFATGSRDNSIHIWDIRCPSDSKAANTIRSAHTLPSSGGTPKASKKKRGSTSVPSSSVTAIQFQDQNTLISASDFDGIIKVWDLRKSYDRFNKQSQSKYAFPYPGKTTLKGYSSLDLDVTKSNLFASCKDHTIYKFELASYNEKPVASYTGFEHNNKYFNKISLSHDGRFLASGSSDSFARIWNVTSYGPSEPIAKLDGHEAEVTCVEWCPVGFKLITCGDDMKHRTWRLTNLQKEQMDKNILSGETIMCEDVKYYSTPVYQPSVLPKLPYEEPTKVKAKRRIFESVESRDNVENQKLSNVFHRPSLPQTPTKGASGLSFSSFPCSPTKMSVSPRTSVFSSPKKLLFSPRKLAIFNSPTSHLPNLVLDENSSPSRTSSAKKSQQLDWLTTLSRQKKQQTHPEHRGAKRKSDSSEKSENSPRPKRLKIKF